MTDHRMDGQIPPPAAPTAEEWEPFLRARRSTDDNPIVLTERQVARIQWITAAVADTDSPDHGAALDQLADVNSYLRARLVESSHGEGLTSPTAAEVWAQLDAKPHFLRGSHHERRIQDLHRRGLDPYGRPLGSG